MSEKKIFLRRTHLGSQILSILEYFSSSNTFPFQILFLFGILFHFQTLFIIIKKYFNTFSIFFHHFFSSKSLFFSFFILFSVISTKLTHLYYLLHISLPFCVDTKLCYTLFFSSLDFTCFIAFLSFMFGSPNCCEQYGDTNVACFSGFVQVYMILHKSYDNIPEKHNLHSIQRIDAHRL